MIRRVMKITHHDYPLMPEMLIESLLRCVMLRVFIYVSLLRCLMLRVFIYV